VNARSKPWYGRWWAIVLLIALVIGATGMLTVKVLGLRSVRVDAEPFVQPERGFDYGWWEPSKNKRPLRATPHAT